MHKCNHLVPKQDREKKCNPSDSNSKTHFWIPTGRIEGIGINNMISVDFLCKYCNKRTTNFLTQEDYNLNKKLLIEV